jgi:uncharacterized membrane protein YqjE
MPEASSEDRRTAEAEGLWGHLAGLLGAKLAYLRARAELAGIEGREAAIHYGLALGLAVGAVVLLVFGYFFLVLAAVFAVAWICGGGNVWIWVLLGAAVLHLVAAGGLILAVRMKIARPIFTATLDEFRKDQAWLTTPAKPN